MWAAAVLLAAMDYGFRFSDLGLRILATGCLVGSFAWGAARYLWPILRTPFSRRLVARQLELRFPEWEDGLTAAVEFASAAEDDLTIGSPALRRAAILAMERRLADFDESAVLRREPVRRSAVLICGILGTTVLLAVAFPGTVRTGVQRLLMPWADLPWPRQTELVVVEWPRRVALGGTARIAVSEKHGRLPRLVAIEYEWESESGRVLREQRWMRRVGDRMIDERENVAWSFRFRVSGGDDDTQPWYRVEVVEPPKLRRFDVTAIPPAYSGFAPETSDGPLTVLAGSSIKAELETDKPLGNAILLFADGSVVPGKPGDGPTVWYFHSGDTVPDGLQQSGNYALVIEDQEGVSVPDRPEWPIVVVQDGPPNVWFDDEEVPRLMTVAAGFDLTVRAKDDLALRRVSLVAGIRDDPSRQATQVLHEGPEPFPKMQATMLEPDRWGEELSLPVTWNAASVSPLPGDVVEWRLLAEDYKGQQASSQTIAVRCVTREEYLQYVAGERNTLADALSRLLEAQEEASRGTEVWFASLPKDPASDERTLDALRSVQLLQRRVSAGAARAPGSIRERAEKLRRRLAANGLADSSEDAVLAEIVSVLDEVSTLHLIALDEVFTALVKNLESAAAAKSPVDGSFRDQEQTIKLHQQAVVETLRRLLDRLGRRRTLDVFRRQLEQLRDDQQVLHDRTKQLGRLLLSGDATADEVAGMLDDTARTQRETALRADQVFRDIDKEMQRADDRARSVLEQVATAAAETALTAKMRDAALGIEQTQVTIAYRLQEEALAALDRILALFEQEREPESLESKRLRLKNLLGELVRRQRQLADAAEVAAAESDAAAKAEMLQKLREEQARILEDVDAATSLADAVEAEDVSVRTQRAEKHMQQAIEAADRLAAEEFRTQAAQAADALDDADEACRQAELERTRREQERQIEKWLQEATALAAHQRELLERTRRLQEESPVAASSDADRQAWRRRAEDTATSQRLLAEDTRRLGGAFESQPVLNTVLEEAAVLMDQAADRVAAESVDAMTRSLQQAALTRLLHVTEALRQTREASRASEQQPPEENDPSQEQKMTPEQQRQAALRLAELKLLKSLQLELNADTVEIDRQIAAAASSDRFEGELRRLAERQQQIMRWLQQLLAQPHQQSEETPRANGEREIPVEPDQRNGDEEKLPTLDELLSP
ncbi:hypothetical protein JCM19992_15260 [Thermostilla marina]